ncbi:AsnC family transcriptional regulator [Prauserella sp. PE36]|uniref:Lrp/AsnC family transcriptional regulator n=1 Tax=Prauserella endophytica TaxID=1592324 RepID=A0ABY2SAT9_9PSEU|nr:MULTISPECIES: Lrp/AsnC family transcriptional regulator [Prauserella]PXY28906.1 AsnC family transcriptional regulator [Prauserella coralliicola]RBM17230.1 AsnC family transcriptional regulator [Prauserella sp. PE36]TKG72586.1 Lrp/AsnC family transcriptional regulator [Prauserella endophytica]
MPHDGPVDAVDARILLELAEHPRATTLAVADRVGISRNTAQSRLARLERNGALESFEHRIAPAALGYPLTAFITAQVTQRLLDEVAAALADVPEVLQVQGISGPVDLMIQVVAGDADDLYRIAGRILAIPGVERTNTALVMRQLVDYRITPLLRRALR